MAVKLRLTRMGKNKSPFYRIIAIDSRKAQSGKYLEQIGYYDPSKQPPEVKIDNEIAIKWLKVGAQPTDTVRDLLKKSGAITVKETEKKPVKQEEAKA